MLSILILALMPHVAGTYDTRVTLRRSNCPMTVASNPTEVAQYSDSTTITLRHAGTTYEGTLAPDGSFSTKLKTLDFGQTTYLIGITGRFKGDTLSAEVTLRYGEPRCESVVEWSGLRQRQ
jgi:hypothetical protein